MEDKMILKNKAGTGRGAAAALVSGCLWGSTGVFVRVFDGLGFEPLTLFFVRVAPAFIVMVVAFIVIGRIDLLKIRIKDIWCFIGLAVASTILLNLFNIMAITMLSLSLASILLAIAPVFVVLLSAPLFGEKITSIKVQALVIAFAGCVLTTGLVDSGTVFSPLGVLVGLLAGLGWAFYSIMTRVILNRGYEPLTANAYSFGIGCLICAPFTNFAIIASTASDAPGSSALLFALHTLCTSLLPYVLYTYSMKYIDTGKACILASIEPVAAAVFGFVFFSEAPTAISVIGIALVLFAVALLNIPGGLRSLFKK